MISAFGVEHGEIDKAFGLGALGAKIAGGTEKLGQKATALGGRNAVRVGGLRPKLGAAGYKAGGQLKKLGAGMASRPKLTGGLAAGGAAGGIGGVAALGNGQRNRY